MTIERFISSVKRFGLEHFQRYYSLYPAEVVNNEDPDQRGRVKLKIPSLNLENNAAHPAWANPVVGPVPFGDGYGSYNVPRVGEKVWAWFRQGEVKDLMYFHLSFAPGASKPPGFTDVEDRGFVTRGGHTFKVRDADGDEQIQIKHKTGTEVVISPTGLLTLKTANGDSVKIDPDGKLTVLHRQGAQVALDKDVEVKDSSGDSIKLASGKALLEAAREIELKSRLAVMSAALVRLGDASASHPLVYGELLLSYLLQDFIWKATHVHNIVTPAPGSPTTPPIVPPPSPNAGMISKKTFTS